jgi:phage terminase large subunit-like protein
MYYDENPPSMAHWSYPMFMEGVEPIARTPLDRTDYATMQINPRDNIQNLDPATLKALESLPEKDRKRFLEGEFQANVVGALWSYDVIRRLPAPVSDEEFRKLRDRMKFIVVAVDPSGCSGPEDERSDEIGIVVCAWDMTVVAMSSTTSPGTTRPKALAEPSGRALTRPRRCNDLGFYRING